MSRIIRSSQVIAVDGHHTHEKKAMSIVEKSIQEAEELFASVSLKAKSIIEKAEMKAESILKESIESAKADSKEAVEKSKREGYEAGYREGYEKGQSEGIKKGHEKAYSETENDRKKIIEEANEIKKNCLREKEKTLYSLERELIELVREISEKVINHELEKPDYMVDLVLKGLASLNDKDNIVIRVSKEDYEPVNRFKPEILAKGSLIEDITVKLDSNLSKGDCLIESSQGNVNTSLSLQLEEIKKLLDDLLLGSKVDEKYQFE